jgi:hypothetical protein
MQINLRKKSFLLMLGVAEATFLIMTIDFIRLILSIIQRFPKNFHFYSQQPKESDPRIVIRFGLGSK